jgi:ABC-type glycerol-3-phosphate transport system permease component
MKMNEETSIKKNKSHIKLSFRATVTFILLLILAFTTIYPVYFTFISALKDQEAWSRSKFELPIPPYFDNFTTAWKRADVPRTSLNSVVVTFGGVFLCFFVCILAAYACTKLKFKGRNLIFLFLIASMMIPVQTILYPFFKLLDNLRLTDNYGGLIIAFTTFEIPITLYQYNAFLKRIPNSLIEAARIDGASTRKIIFRIIVPIAQPVIFTAGLINFAWMWNNLLLPIMTLQNPKVQTLVVSLAQLKGQYGTFPTLVCAGSFIGILPLTVIYLFAQKRIVKGMTIGALKE